MHISQTFIDPPSIFVSLVMLHRQGLRLTPILVLVEGWTREGRTVLLDASKLFANDTDVDSETLTVMKVDDGENGSVLPDGVIMPLWGCGWAIPEPGEVKELWRESNRARPILVFVT